MHYNDQKFLRNAAWNVAIFGIIFCMIKYFHTTKIITLAICSVVYVGYVIFGIKK